MPSLRGFQIPHFGIPKKQQDKVLQDASIAHVASFNYVLREGIGHLVKSIPPLEIGLPNGIVFNVPHKRSEAFNFKKLCLFCGQVADEATEIKKKYRCKIRKLSTLEFKDNVLRKAERSDSIGELVKDHILCEYALISSETKYHTLYNANFLNRLSSTEKKPCQDNQVSEAMAEIFNYIKNHDDSQFSLKELRDVLMGYVPDDKTIIMRLQQKDPEEEWLRIVEAGAAIIREDIRSSVIETKCYPPANVLYNLGFEALYGKTVQYEISTAYHPQPRILSLESGTLVEYVGDHTNINVHTLDGNNTLHFMEIVTPKDIY
ncbi:SWIM-type domain-containing protein [Trichonephila inaurata madagascariensis]|uniref:SWIM-type domain-containing protein n=1 Tax=Trichonephila inaurata madagascariensis TaxID=2747483 RepID=A0A8X6MG42_9ARAC|nr:SWIM-type domain-containing protein [Trichonephila inaurata madagascariensis]